MSLHYLTWKLSHLEKKGKKFSQFLKAHILEVLFSYECEVLTVEKVSTAKIVGYREHIHSYIYIYIYALLYDVVCPGFLACMTNHHVIVIASVCLNIK